MGIFIPFVLICIITAVLNPVFLYPENIVDVLRSISFTVIVGVGMTFVLICAGIDLSVGAVVGLGGVIAAIAMLAEIPIIISIILALLLGAFIGLINGLVIVKLKIPPMIATLGMMYIARGVIYVITRGKPVYPLPEAFKQISQGDLFGVPYPVYIALVIILLGNFLLKHTLFGRRVMAIGGNEETARTSGINIAATKVMVYLLVSVLSSVTGVLYASRLSSAQANAGTGLELTVIASVIIGGTSLFGGAGSVFGTLIGTAIMTVLTNAMVLLKVSVYWQNIVVGAIIILAVAIDTFRRNRMSGRRG